ncbi:hypothetical protein [Chryseobacterium daeguense]|uniref:hypothetical protein n=1 Tax=Chryseobacterium daeguense TaxID=412438 RepID=UPI00048020D0|nr:hypothetical protein [Chryseobacterium daeguense]
METALNYNKMKKTLRISFFLLACLLLTACPGGSYIKYKLVGGKRTSFNDYDAIVVNQSDTILLKVGVIETKVREKKKAVIVRFENLKGFDFNIESSKYGKLSKDTEDQNIFKKEIKSVNSKDTVKVSYNSQTFYFTRE